MNKYIYQCDVGETSFTKAIAGLVAEYLKKAIRANSPEEYDNQICEILAGLTGMLGEYISVELKFCPAHAREKITSKFKETLEKSLDLIIERHK